MNSRKLLIGCGFAMILGLGVLFIVGVFASLPGVEQQIPAGTGSILVNISLPSNGSQLPLNQPLSIYVQAFGDQPLQEIQLLVDGAPQLAGDSSPAGEKKMMATWAFTPDKEGSHTLLARATGQNGQAGISNAVHINIIPADQISVPLVEGGIPTPQVVNDEGSQTGPEGGTPGSASPGFNDQGSAANPPPFPTEPPGQEPPAEPPQQPGDNLIPIEFSLWIQNIFGASLPAAPTLDGGANQCDGILVVQDNSTDEAGFFIYRLGPGQVLFERVATLNGQSGKASFSYHDPSLAQGSYSYYVSAFNAAGESPSNIITIHISDGQCANVTPPSLSFDSLKLKTKTPVALVYCYVSVDGGPWKRVPSSPEAFIPSVNGEFDLAPYLGALPKPTPPKTQLTLDFECWGWSGSTLTYLGAGQQSWNPNDNLVLIGQLFEIDGIGSSKPMSGEWPQSNLIAPPFNAKITNDPNDCKGHVGQNNYSANVAQCEAYMAVHGYFLVWDWSQYGDCDPESEPCNMNYQPADRFHIYTIEKGETKLSPLTPLQSSMAFTYVPAMDGSIHIKYFVRAFDYQTGMESPDSNHVTFPLEETTINPTSLEIRSYEIFGDGSAPPQAYNYPTNGGVLFSGYAFMPIHQSYRDVWATSTINFTLPENLNIQSARLNWKNKSYTTYGPGANNVNANCGVILKNANWYQNLNTSLWGSENYDVTQPVLMAKMKAQPSIYFWFEAPMWKKPDVRPDACLWYISNLSLTLYYIK